MLKIAAIVAAIFAAGWGLLIYASPRPADQLAGKVVIAGALGIFILALLSERPWAKAALWLTIIAVAGFTIYVWLRWSGRL